MASNVFSPVSSPVRRFHNWHYETASSTVNTPSSIASSFLGTPNSAPRRQYPVRQSAKSIADSHTNWRMRAGQAGIKVGPYEGDDESEEDPQHESEQSLLPPADVPNRSFAASTMGPAPLIMHSTMAFVAQDGSPPVQRVDRSNNVTNMATPPRNNMLLARRGWETDPQQPHPIVSPNALSSRLFDISEDAGKLSDEKSIHYFGNILDSNNVSFDYEDDLNDAEYCSTNSFPPSQARIQPRHASVLPGPLVHGLRPQPQQQFIHANYPTPPSTPPPPGYSPDRLMRSQSMKNGMLRSLPSKQNQERFYEDFSGPVPEVEESEEDTIMQPVDIKACAVCGETPWPAVYNEEKDNLKLKLAVLAPCLHLHCCQCITSAINVVGEKELECGLCRSHVAGMNLIEIAADVEKPEKNGESFRVEAAPVAAASQTPSQPTRRILSDQDLNVPATTSSLKRTKALGAMYSVATSLTAKPTSVSKPSRRWDEASSEHSYIASPLPTLGKKGEEYKNIGRDKNFIEDPLFSSPRSKVSSASEVNYFGIDPTTEDGDESGEGEMAVLRIDNVPWDITPPLISSWLATPGLVRCHVLLDQKGKTKSHAYVECGRGREGEERGKIVLRGVTGGQCGDLTRGGKRSGILGKGSRARGVTVTRSGEEELMRDLFPTFPGSFTAYAAGGQNQKRGCKPTLLGLPNSAVRLAFERGLVGDEELTGLVTLLRDPGSHFLKTPSLPFHLLASMLSKYLADEDSRVVSWGAGWKGRDRLFDVTVAALEVLHARLDMLKSEGKGEDAKAYDGVMEDLVGVAGGCRSFSEAQKDIIEGTIKGWESLAEVAKS